MTRTAPPPPRTSPILRYGVPALGVLLIIWLLYFLAGHATRLPPSAPVSRGTSRAVGNDLDGVREIVRRDTSLANCRNAVAQLNAHFARNPQAPRPAAPTEAERGLFKQLQLDEDELNEVGSTTFTLLDAHHLDQVFLLSDAARSLDIEGLSDRDRAVAAFAWVVRQVRLRDADGDPVPPAYTLRRGWGTPQERALVFLALLEQLGIPGCMIAVPGEGNEPRYWVPGALADGEIYLFDPRLGLPLPGSERGDILTLAQLRTKPELLQSLPTDKDFAYDLTPAQAQKAEPHVAVALSSLAPRMRFLRDEVLVSGKARPAADAAARLAAFQTAINKRAFVGATVRLGTAPTSSLRCLRAFLGPDDGGADRPGKPGEQWLPRRARFERGLTPWQVLPAQVRPLPADVDPGLRLRHMFARPFIDFAQQPRKPRDQMLRGRLDEATGGLVEALTEFDRLRTAQQSDKELPALVAAWIDGAKKAQADVLIAESESTRNKSPESLAALKAALTRLADVWDPKQSQRPLLALVGTAAEPLRVEASYYLALCKHEQAEQAQAALERRQGKTSDKETAAAQESWRDAATWWRKYLEEQPGSRDETAARMHLARALEKQGDASAARELLANPPPRSSPWEKLACRLRLRDM